MENREYGPRQAGQGPRNRQAGFACLSCLLVRSGPNKQARQADRQARQAICSAPLSRFPRIPTFILRAVYSTKKEKTFSLTRLRPPLRGVGGFLGGGILTVFSRSVSWGLHVPCFLEDSPGSHPDCVFSKTFLGFASSPCFLEDFGGVCILIVFFRRRSWAFHFDDVLIDPRKMHCDCSSPMSLHACLHA